LTLQLSVSHLSLSISYNYYILNKRNTGLPCTSYRLFTTALILAYKLHIDAPLRIISFKRLLGPYFETHELVAMERQFLGVVGWRVSVSSEEFLRFARVVHHHSDHSQNINKLKK
jgi:hypothetical protein